MSTLWTPDGERPIRREPASTNPPPSSESAPPPGAPAGSAPPPPGAPAEGEPDEAEVRARMAELSEQMAHTPAAVIIANHAYGLFELAALHLSRQPPQLNEARTAIDGFAALVEGMAGRLGDAEPQLIDGLSQLRMAFVEISRSAAPGSQPGPAEGA
ncbi:MAG: hypothetical protein ACR2MN_10440 [Acidimicrobiales bacterium]